MKNVLTFLLIVTVTLLVIGVLVTKFMVITKMVEPEKVKQVNIKGYLPNKKNIPKEQSELDAKINLPQGFSIDYYAKNIEGARSLATNNNGLIFVGTRAAGNVYVIEDLDNNNIPENTYTIASNLDNPNGVAYLNGNLYVAEISRILVFENIDETYKVKPDFKVIKDDYPKDKLHGWKYIAIGPDNKLYVPVGAPCNICNNGDPYNTITRIDTDGSNFEIVARGIRNTVGFTWDNQDDLWFTDNGRDWFGDDLPPDELNVITSENQNFGYPFCHGGEYLDDEYGTQGDCELYSKPAQNLGPHVAALGLKFPPNDYPTEYLNKVFIAEHGSWNRSTPIGYRISMVDVNQQNNTATNYQVFADGWLENNGTSWGRPVDILFLEDNTMLVSDDKANAIYKITYTN